MGSFVQPTTTDKDGADGINEVVHGVDVGGQIRPLGHGSRRGEKSRQQHDAHHKEPHHEHGLLHGVGVGGYEEKAGQGQPKNLIPWDTLAEFFKKNLK